MERHARDELRLRDTAAAPVTENPPHDPPELEVSVSQMTIQVRVPESANGDNAAAIFTGLHHLLGFTPLNYDWEVDLSRVKRPTLALISVLVSLESRLREQGGHLSVLGLRVGAFSPGIQQMVLTTFPECKIQQSA